ncbi:MAG TPA: site-2 protease family protein [Candidatus Thermoplasmatota archaeon]|nr:site-2 protease family protein [Candidatus Thermoplasmatota archaeon]
MQPTGAIDRWDETEDEPTVSFSGEEILHLALSVAVLSVAFTFALSGTALAIDGKLDESTLLAILPYAVGIVITSFVLHELAHKVVAQRRYMWAEFRASWTNLLVGLLVSMGLGVVFAAPGAVHIYGQATRRDSGVISIVGPALNLGLALIALPMFLFTPELCVARHANLWQVVVFVNVFLAGFNMLPIPPLDGSKVWAWSKLAYLSTLLVIAAFAYVVFDPSVVPGVSPATGC